METFDIYQDIMKRTGGDIYIGVVGPVRTGKSTFIKRFMENLVVPNIVDENRRERIIDELPESADGKTIMTTEPKFVPDGGVSVDFGEGLSANVRLIDSVGYIVSDASGYMEGDVDRYVSTPWSKDKMTFREAGEYGTKKVITDHSTVGIVITTDGSISSLPRESYEESEEKVISDMKALGKPFVVILNSTNPSSKKTKELCLRLCEKYSTRVVPMDILDMNKEDADSILQEILFEFPISGIEIDMPTFMAGLNSDNEIISDIMTNLMSKVGNISKMADYKLFTDIDDNPYLDKIVSSSMDFGKGIITYELIAKDNLFYDVISSESGVKIDSDLDLVSYIKRLKMAEILYSKVGDALQEVDKLGYGIVAPKISEIEVGEPTLYKKGGKCQVKIHTKSTSLHIMKVDVESDICPIMGTESQCNEMIDYINNECANTDIMDITLFNKPLSKMVESEISSRLDEVTQDTRAKMVKTMSRIVNEGKGGVLCVLI